MSTGFVWGKGYLVALVQQHPGLSQVLKTGCCSRLGNAYRARVYDVAQGFIVIFYETLFLFGNVNQGTWLTRVNHKQ